MFLLLVSFPLIKIAREGTSGDGCVGFILTVNQSNGHERQTFGRINLKVSLSSESSFYIILEPSSYAVVDMIVRQTNNDFFPNLCVARRFNHNMFCSHVLIG